MIKINNMEKEETIIPKDSVQKLTNALTGIDEWKAGRLSDYDVRATLAFSCCTILRDMIGGTNWWKVLLDLYTKILQHPR